MHIAISDTKHHHCPGMQPMADTGTTPNADFRIRKSALLNRIGNAVLQESPIAEVINVALEGACALLGTPRATVRLTGPPECIHEYRVMGFPSVGELLPALRCPQTGEPLYVDGRSLLACDILKCAPYTRQEQQLAAVRLGAFLGTPMIARGEFLGVLFIDRPEPHRWLDWELSAAESIARQIAIAVRHAQLFMSQEQLSGKLAALVNNVPGAVYHANPAGDFTLVGDNILEMTGRPPSDFVDGEVRWADLVLPGDRERMMNESADAVRLRLRGFRMEYRIRHLDGSVRWIADRHQLCYGQGGKPSGMDGLLLDITDRKKAEEDTVRAARALRESEERYALALRGSNDGIWDWNVHTGEVYFSSRMKAMLGYREDELAPTIDEWTARIHPDDFDHVIASLQAHLSGKAPTFEVEYRLRHRDGTDRWLLARSVALADDRGEPCRIAGSHTDLTTRRQLEDDLLQAQKMDAIGQLASGVAHDFNNMLTAIRGYADLLMLRSAGCPDNRREIEEIIKASDRATGLTQQLLAFSRKQVLQTAVSDMNAIVANLEPMLRRLIGEHIDLVAVLQPDLSRVRVDRGQFEQVLLNLSVNARDAMPEGGTLRIETANLPGGRIELRVADSGHGMDDATASRVFEPFFTTKAQGKGTGLGLSTVYGIVKQSGGEVGVTSRPGIGTTFRVLLPAIASEPAESGDPNAGQGDWAGGRETVLLVEDEESVRRLVSEVLREAGYAVLEASDGKEALESAGRHDGPVHLVLTDVVMPRMGGFALAGAVSGLLPDTRILYMSGYTTDPAIRDGLAQDGIAFLQKPFTPDVLVRKVREELDRWKEAGKS
jgi:PAS domain S-box-containing protein